MYRINEDKVKARKNELRDFKGWLPFDFTAYVSLYKRKQYLQRLGLWEQVQAKNLEVMQGIRDNKPNEDVYLETLLRRWIADNPKFAEFVTFE